MEIQSEMHGGPLTQKAHSIKIADLLGSDREKAILIFIMIVKEP